MIYSAQQKDGLCEAVRIMMADWLETELAASDFEDYRIGIRFRKLVRQLWNGIGESIPLVCQDWANTKAAYRFLSNKKVSEREILQGHFAATKERFDETDGPILVLHDTHCT